MNHDILHLAFELVLKTCIMISSNNKMQKMKFKEITHLAVKQHKMLRLLDIDHCNYK